jgi:hypothetical protein
MKLTKTFINKFIIWTSSRYNERKKPSVIKEIMEGMNNNGIISYKRNEANTDWIEYKAMKVGMKEDGLPRHPTTIRFRTDKD